MHGLCQLVTDQSVHRALQWLNHVLLVCRYTDDNDAIATPDGALDGTHVAALHYQHAPAFMQRFHPAGVAGKDALVQGAAFSNEEGQGLYPIWAAKWSHQKAGEAINFAVLRDWFLPRYQAWKDGRGGAVTVAEAAAAIGSNAAWVQMVKKPDNVEWLVTLERGAS